MSLAHRHRSSTVIPQLQYLHCQQPVHFRWAQKNKEAQWIRRLPFRRLEGPAGVNIAHWSPSLTAILRLRSVPYQQRGESVHSHQDYEDLD